MKLKLVLGRTDLADFPKLGLEDVPVKVDTGAYTSSIHCRQLDVEVIDGEQVLCFTLLEPSHTYGVYEDEEVVHRTTQFRETIVRSSNGQAEKRFLIKSRIMLFGKLYPISLTLSKRAQMRFPILIGRKFLMGKFVVDPSLLDLSYQHKLTQKAP